MVSKSILLQLISILETPEKLSEVYATILQILQKIILRAGLVI